MNYFTLLAATALMGGALGCRKAAPVPAVPFTASFQVLNERGQPATSFALGQNVVFRL